MPRRTQVPSRFHFTFRIRDSHPLRCTFPCASPMLRLCFFDGPSTPNLDSVWAPSLSLAATQEIILYFPFLQVLRCFSSLGIASYTFTVYDARTSLRAGSPIRISTALRVLTAYRRISLFAASFFAGSCLGIPHTPFLALPLKISFA